MPSLPSRGPISLSRSRTNSALPLPVATNEFSPVYLAGLLERALGVDLHRVVERTVFEHDVV